MSANGLGHCRVCLVADATEEEHVWPAGYLRRLDAISTTPHTWKTNGEPVRKPNGQPVAAQNGRQRMFLPVCRPCNAGMERYIEKPGQPLAVSTQVARWTKPLDSHEWTDLGRWWFKVLMMMCHPDLRIGDVGLHKARPLSQMEFRHPLPDLSWLATSASIPDHASLIVYNADLQAAPLTELHLTFPRLVDFVDGSVQPCHQAAIASEGVGLLAVWHPGLTLIHPLVESGDAWEVLKSPPTSRSPLASLSPKSHRLVANIEGSGRVQEGHQIDASEASNSMARPEL